MEDLRDEVGKRGRTADDEISTYKAHNALETAAAELHALNTARGKRYSHDRRRERERGGGEERGEEKERNGD